MPDPVEREPYDEPAHLQRRPVYNDLRDDYDDEFGGDRTPLGIARRRVQAPAIAFILIGILGIGGVLIGAGVAVVDFLESRQRPGEIIQVLFLLAACGLGLGLLGVVIAGGLCMKSLRRRGLALAAAYIVTGLSIAGCYGILFYPFGIWALILLYQPQVRDVFRRPPDPVDD
jgi:hypothetical protein